MTRFVFTLLIAGAISLFGTFTLAHNLPTYWIAILVYLFITTIGVTLFLKEKLLIGKAAFVRVYLATIIIKLILHGAFIFLILAVDPVGSAGNASFFLVVYFLNTLVAVLYLFQTARRKA